MSYSFTFGDSSPLPATEVTLYSPCDTFWGSRTKETVRIVTRRWSRMDLGAVQQLAVQRCDQAVLDIAAQLNSVTYSDLETVLEFELAPVPSLAVAQLRTDEHDREEK